MAKLKGSFPSLLSCFLQLYLFFASVLPTSFELSPAIQPWLTDCVIQWSKFQFLNRKTSRLDNAERQNSGFQKPHKKPRLPSDQGEKGPWMFFSLLHSAVASSVFEVGFNHLATSVLPRRLQLLEHCVAHLHFTNSVRPMTVI